MRERTIRITLVVVDLFLAASAIVGAIGLVVGFMNIPVSGLHGTPFKDFTVPALLLGFVVGGSALIASVITVAEPLLPIRPLRIAQLERLGISPLGIAPLASAVAGCIMVGWMVVELAMIGLDIWVQPAYLVVGLVMVGLAALLQWTEMQPRLEAQQPGQTAVGSGRQHAA
jgi:hypothetical protein